MRTILGLMILAMAVMVMGCGEPTTTTDAGVNAASTTGCDCCADCDKCEDGKKCECTSKDGSDCNCKCKDGAAAAAGEAVVVEGEGSGVKVDTGSGAKVDAGSGNH